MARYALRSFGGPVLISAPPVVIVPPANIVLYARKGNMAVKVREGDK